MDNHNVKIDSTILVKIFWNLTNFVAQVSLATMKAELDVIKPNFKLLNN